jgi:hypothetical protein
VANKEVKWTATVDTDGAVTGLKKLAKEFLEAKQKADNFAGGITKSINSLAKWGSAAVGTATVAAAAFIKMGIDSADALAKQSRALGMSGVELQELQRAADLSGISTEQLTTAMRTMTVGLGQAAQGTGTAKDLLKQLGVSLSDLSNMSGAEKIAFLTEKINETIPASQRAAAMADLFGSRSALAMQNLDPDSIKRAAEEVDKFGVALSEVQLAQIEEANDEMSVFGEMMKGVQNQLAAEFAPIIAGASKEIANAAKESGLFDGAIQKAVDIGVNGAGLLADAWRGFEYILLGLKGVWYAIKIDAASQIEAIMQAFQAMKNAVIDVINGLIEAANTIPGVEIDLIIPEPSEALRTVTNFKNEANIELATIADEIRSLMEEPLPSEKLNALVSNWRAVSQAAAEAAVAQRGAMGGGDGNNNDKSQELSPELKKLQDETVARYQELMNRYKSEYELKQEKLDEEYALEAEKFALAFSNNLMTQEEAQQALLESQKEYEDKSKALVDEAEKAKRDLRRKTAEAAMQGTVDMLKNISSAMGTESKKAFEIQKAAQIGETIMSTYSSAQSAFQSFASIPIVGTALGAAAAAAAIAAGMARVQAIKSQQFKGGGSAGGDPGASASVASAPAAAQTQPERQVANISLVGDMFGRNQVIGLMESMNELMADGVRLNVK